MSISSVNFSQGRKSHGVCKLVYPRGLDLKYFFMFSSAPSNNDFSVDQLQPFWGVFDMTPENVERQIKAMSRAPADGLSCFPIFFQRPFLKVLERLDLTSSQPTHQRVV